MKRSTILDVCNVKGQLIVFTAKGVYRMDNNRKRFLKVKPRIGALPKGAFARLVTFLLIPCRVLPCRGLLYAVYAVASAFLLSVAQAGDAPRDGTWWQQLPAGEKEWWTLGWMDGAAAGTRILGGIKGSPEAAAYQSAVMKFLGNTSDQITQGIDQFYAADFRNLRVQTADAALLVSMYAKGLPAPEATKLAADLRAIYNGSRAALPNP